MTDFLEDTAQQDASECCELSNQIIALLQGKDVAVGLPPLIYILRLVSLDLELPETRAAICTSLRELADELEAVDATRH